MPEIPPPQPGPDPEPEPRDSNDSSASYERGPARRIGVVVAGVIATGLLGLLVFGLIARSPDTTIDDALARGKGTPAPAYRLQVLESGALGPVLAPRLRGALVDNWLSAAELRGTPHVLNIWASWCDPCRVEARVLQRAWRTARPRGVLFVGLDMQDVQDDARAFIHQFGIDYLNIRDPTNATARSYGATGVPETYFVSAHGQIVGHVVGVVSPPDLQTGIAAALAGTPEPPGQGGERQPQR